MSIFLFEFDTWLTLEDLSFFLYKSHCISALFFSLHYSLWFVTRQSSETGPLEVLMVAFQSFFPHFLRKSSIFCLRALIFLSVLLLSHRRFYIIMAFGTIIMREKGKGQMLERL